MKKFCLFLIATVALLNPTNTYALTLTKNVQVEIAANQKNSNNKNQNHSKDTEPIPTLAITQQPTPSPTSMPKNENKPTPEPTKVQPTPTAVHVVAATSEDTALANTSNISVPQDIANVNTVKKPTVVNKTPQTNTLNVMPTQAIAQNKITPPTGTVQVMGANYYHSDTLPREISIILLYIALGLFLLRITVLKSPLILAGCEKIKSKMRRQPTNQNFSVPYIEQ